MTTALEQRNMIKKKKPTFRQPDSHKRKSIAKPWRAPKGLQSKVRLSRRGYARAPAVGFGSPKAVKHLTRSGKKLKLVFSPADLALLGDAVGVVAATVGNRKKKLIAEEAKANNIPLHNLHSEQFLTMLQQHMQTRKQTKKTKQKSKAAVVEKKKGIEEKLDDEARKKEEKEKKDKIITRRDTA